MYFFLWWPKYPPDFKILNTNHFLKTVVWCPRKHTYKHKQTHAQTKKRTQGTQKQRTHPSYPSKASPNSQAPIFITFLSPPPHTRPHALALTISEVRSRRWAVRGRLLRALLRACGERERKKNIALNSCLQLASLSDNVNANNPSVVVMRDNYTSMYTWLEDPLGATTQALARSRVWRRGRGKAEAGRIGGGGLGRKEGRGKIMIKRGWHANGKQRGGGWGEGLKRKGGRGKTKMIRRE